MSISFRVLPMKIDAIMIITSKPAIIPYIQSFTSRTASVLVMVTASSRSS